jgi:pyruvate/2-oxoglutarate dehydrogenase complex dihydrolipoamide acyltransferase (E2) component
VHLVALPRFPEPGSAVAQGSLVAPMPGNVIRVGAEVGETVAAGQPLIWLEAMKMEHTITAPTDGILAELNVQTGQQVEVGAVTGVIASAAAPGEAGHDHQTGVIASAAEPGAAGHDHQTGVIASAAAPGEAGHDDPDLATLKTRESEGDPS